MSAFNHPIFSFSARFNESTIHHQTPLCDKTNMTRRHSCDIETTSETRRDCWYEGDRATFFVSQCLRSRSILAFDCASIFIPCWSTICLVWWERVACCWRLFDPRKLNIFLLSRAGMGLPTASCEKLDVKARKISSKLAITTGPPQPYHVESKKKSRSP